MMILSNCSSANYHCLRNAKGFIWMNLRKYDISCIQEMKEYFDLILFSVFSSLDLRT